MDMTKSPSLVQCSAVLWSGTLTEPEAWMKQFLNMSNVLCFMLFVVGNSVKGKNIQDNPAWRTDSPSFQTISPVEEQNSSVDNGGEVSQETMTDEQVYLHGTNSKSSAAEDTVTSQNGSLVSKDRSDLPTVVKDHKSAVNFSSASNHASIFNYEGAIFSSAVAGFQLMMNGTLTSKEHLSNEKEKPLSQNQALLNSGNQGLTEPITPLSRDTGRSIPLLSLFRPSAGDSLAESNDTQEEKDKNKSENGISQLFRVSYPLNREPLIPSDKAQLSVTRASTETVTLTIPHEKGYTDSKNVITLTLRKHVTGSLKQEQLPSLTTTPSTQVWATTVFPKAFPAGEEAKETQTDGVKLGTGRKAMALTPRMGAALTISSPSAGFSHGLHLGRDEGGATPSSVLPRSSTYQVLPAVHSFHSFGRTPGTREERRLDFYMVSQPQEKIRTNWSSLLLMQKQTYRTEAQLKLSPIPQKASTSLQKKSHFQTTDSFSETLATHHTPLSIATEKKHRPLVFEENKDDEKDNLIQHSTKMVMKSDLSQSESLTLQMSHDTLVSHTMSGKNKNTTGVTLSPLNNFFHKTQPQGELKLGDPRNQTESSEGSVSDFIPVKDKERLAMDCHDCIANTSSSPQTSLAAPLPLEVPPLVPSDVKTENRLRSDSLYVVPFQFLAGTVKASTVFPETSHPKLIKAVVTVEKRTPIPPKIISHPHFASLTTGSGLSQFERQISKTTRQTKHFMPNSTTKLMTITKRLIFPHIFSPRAESLPLRQSTIHIMQEISFSVEKLPANIPRVTQTSTKPMPSVGSLKAADYNKHRQPSVSSESRPMNGSISYSLEKKTVSPVKSLVNQDNKAFSPYITDGARQSSNRTLPVTVSSPADLTKTHDRENMNTKKNSSLSDGSLLLNEGLKDTENADFGLILHVTEASDVSIIPSRPVLPQSGSPTGQNAPEFTMRTVSLPVTRRLSQLTPVSKNKGSHSSPGTRNKNKISAFTLFSPHTQETIIRKQEVEANSTFNVKPDTPVSPVSVMNGIFKYTAHPLDPAVKSKLSHSIVTAAILVRPPEVPLSTAQPREATAALPLEPANHFTTLTGEHAVQLVPPAYASPGDQESLLDTRPAAAIEHTSPHSLKVVSERQTHSPADAMTISPSSDHFVHQTASDEFSLHFLGIQNAVATDMMKKPNLTPGVPQAALQHSLSISFPDQEPDVRNDSSVSAQPLLQEDSSGSMAQMSLSTIKSADETDWKAFQPLPLQEGSKSEGVPHGKYFRRAIVAGSESQGAIMVQKMRLLSPGLFLSGLADVSDDDCGTGNYTAEMSLSLDSEVLPGDSVPALGNLHVVISLKTNSSQANLTVKSCCISPSAQPDQLNATCCLFSRLPVDPRGIMLLPSDLSSSASFTIRLFQMTNHSTAYLHCDLSVCPRNHTDCERCLQHRHLQFEDGVGRAFTGSGNRISFGPVLKGMESTVTDRTGPDNTARTALIWGSGLGCLLLLITLLLLWLGHRHKKMSWAWPWHSDQGGQKMWGHWV